MTPADTWPSDVGRAVLDTVPNRLFIGGDWVDAEVGSTVDVYDRATGAVIRTIAEASVADGRRALDAAVATQQSWAATSRCRRGTRRRVHGGDQAHRARPLTTLFLAELLREQGSRRAC